ncbi:MAG TPA: cadmium-translocating P-type ATPase [Phycisphaerales bacterium]|nr:cadmium-translocating P-type ATPase [Phycisphaerales bacterium]
MATHTPVQAVPHASHDHAHSHEHGVECCAHHELRLERWIIVYMIGGTLVFVGWAAQAMGLVEKDIAQIPTFLGALLLGAGLFYSAAKELLRGTWSSSTLAAIAILAALATGMYTTAGALAFILLVADQALRRTAWGARRAIEQLVQLTPDVARLVTPQGEREAPLSEVQVGMTVRVRAGENLPVDGVVISGRSMINQASLTGEAAPVEVQEGSPAYAGTTNLTGNLDLRVTQIGADTTIGKVAALIHAAESQRTPRQLLIEQVARYFVPVALVVAGLVWYVTKDVETAISVLVVVCPSALLLSSPTAMMAAFAAAARLGIMIKQTSYLDAAANVDTIIFDKTGTLTTGRFAVSRLAPAPGVQGADLLQAAATAEQHSNHPLAKSIMQTASEARVAPQPTGHAEEVHGQGVRCKTDKGELFAGRPSWLRKLNPRAEAEIAAVEEKIEGMTGVHVMLGDQYLGAVGLEDKLRYNAKGVIEKVRELGARSIMLFTGDRFAVAKRVGVSVGVDRLEAECLPEEKHDLVRTIVSKGGRVLMVGDGINDGPSLAAADVGVAMGLSGSDIATNSAGVALMNDDLSRVPFLIMLARRTRAIIAQNIAASIIIALIGLVTAATGTLGLTFAVFYHFVGDVFVIGNSFRLIRFGEDFAATASDQFAAQRDNQGAAVARRAASASIPRAQTA